MKYKVGDWVQLIDHRGVGWNVNGLMDKFIGKEVQITKLRKYHFDFTGSEEWAFNINNDIAGYAKNKIVTDILMDL